MTKKKIVMISVASVLAAGLVAAEIAIPLSSYMEFRIRKDAVVDAVITRDSETLKSIKAELKDGVRYYENGLAAPTNDDLVVTAKYGGKYAPATYVMLESDEFTISGVSDGFAESGGDISVIYNGKLTELHCDLTPLELESATVSENPYIVAYGNNDKFDPNGMVVRALFNDGITRDIDTFLESTETLSVGKESAACSFTYLGKTYGFDVPVTVTETVDNGEIKELVLSRDTTMVKAGEQITQANVMGLYESGNRIKLDPDEYYFAEDKTAVLGEECTLQAVLVDNEELTVDVPVRVYRDLECESGNAVGGLKKSTATINNINSYDPYTRTFTPTDESATVLNESFKTKVAAYNFDELQGISFTVEMKEACYGDLVLRTTNGMYMGDTTRNMAKYAFDDVWSFNVNGSMVHAAKDVVVPGVNPSDELLAESTSTPAWNALRSVLVDVRVRHVQFQKGTNEITLYRDWKNSKTVNTWNEIGGELLDRIRVEVTDFSSPHVLGEFTEAVEPTCTENGVYAHAICSICGNMVDDSGNNILNPIPALGHDYGEYVINEDTHVRHCARCGYEDIGTHEYHHVNTDSANHYDKCDVCGNKINVEDHNLKISFILKDKVYDISHEFTKDDVKGGMMCSDCGYIDDVSLSDFTIDVKNNGSIRNAVVVTYNATTYEIPFVTKVEAEDSSVCTLSGGLLTEVIDNNVLGEDGNIVPGEGASQATVIKDFKIHDDNWVNTHDANWSDSHPDRSITVKLNVEKAGYYKIGINLTNFMYFGGGVGKMEDVQLNKYFSLTVNGGSSIIPDTAIIRGCGSDGNPVDIDSLFTYLNYIELNECYLEAGENTLVFKLDVASGMKGNQWTDYGDLKVDYFTFELAEHPESEKE